MLHEVVLPEVARRPLFALVMTMALSVFWPASIAIAHDGEQAAPVDRKERSADELRAMLANQPDFVASIDACNFKRPGSAVSVGRLAKRASTYRIEFSPQLFGPSPRGTISFGQTVWLVTTGSDPNGEYTSDAMVPSRRSFLSKGDEYESGLFLAVLSMPYVSFVSPQWMSEICGLRDAGTETVNGMRCAKIQVGTQQGEHFLFYLSEKHRNLIVRIVARESADMELGGPWSSFNFDGVVIDLKNVRLTSDPSQFRVPVGYRKIASGRLYLDEMPLDTAVAKSTNMCPPPATTGEVGLKQLCVEPIPVNKAPVANRISLERNVLRVGESVAMQVDAVDPDGDVLRYEWVSPKGGIVDTRGSNARFDATGLAPGTYQVSVTVRDGAGHTITKDATIEVLVH